MFQLVTTDDLGGAIKFPIIKPNTTVGRLPENDIVLTDPEVSRNHVVIKLRNSRVWLQDLSSDNGVFVNNERINGVRWLNNGDEIIIGSNQFKVELVPDNQNIDTQTLVISKAKARKIYESTLSLKDLPPDDELSNLTISMERKEMIGKLYHKKIGVLATPAMEIMEGQNVVRRYMVLEGEFTIGRRPKNNIVIDDPAISSIHAKIVRVGGRYQIYDQDSKNGTRVNSEPVKSKFLQHYDTIEIGTTKIRFALPKKVKAPEDRPEPRPELTTEEKAPTQRMMEAVKQRPLWEFVAAGIGAVILLIILLYWIF